MTLIEFIDIKNPEHLSAIKHWMDNRGVWSKEFYDLYLEDLEFDEGWQSIIMAKLAKAYLKEKC